MFALLLWSLGEGARPSTPKPRQREDASSAVAAFSQSHATALRDSTVGQVLLHRPAPRFLSGKICHEIHNSIKEHV